MTASASWSIDTTSWCRRTSAPSFLARSSKIGSRLGWGALHISVGLAARQGAEGREGTWFVERVFAGESKRLVDLVRGRRSKGYRRGVSLMALLRRQEGAVPVREKPDDVEPDHFNPCAETAVAVGAQRSEQAPADISGGAGEEYQGTGHVFDSSPVRQERRAATTW